MSDGAPRAPLPVACTLGPAEQGLRRERWLALGERALVEKRVTATGARLRFEADGESEAELRSLASAERMCCGFATWAVRREDREFVLEVDGPPDAVPAIRALFELEPSD
jgi:hypothetical protein